ncbi:general odorant-binding protein 67-like [Armigeres subalbatus]|uniref:general odorant-binding protein 67-like n=1 Tax=Armigeres subalbatus TaxID=124917 RepID=UPI002ED416BE
MKPEDMSIKMVFVVTLYGMVVNQVYGQQEISEDCLTRPNTKQPTECCQMPDLIPPRIKVFACIKKIIKSRGPHRTSRNPHGFPPKYNCISECLFEQEGVIANGVLSKEAATTALIAVVGSGWQTVASTSIETCYAKYSSLGNQKDKLGCSMTAGSFKECVQTTMFTNCPNEFWTANTECAQLKAHLEKGCPLMTLSMAFNR